jgi:uncharacterized alpha-E superfamily protein
VTESTRPVRSRGPLRAVDIKLEYPEGFLPGDAYEVRIRLNRLPDPYERRVIREGVLAGFELDTDRGFLVSASLEIDEVNPESVLSYLQAVTESATGLREQAMMEMERLSEMARHVRQTLRPRSQGAAEVD